MTLHFARYGHIWYQNDGNNIPYPMAEMIFAYLNFLANLFPIFEIFGDCDLDLLPKVTIFELDLTIDIRHHVSKTASKLVEWFARYRANRQTDRQTDRRTDTRTHTQTN